jgi:hypothetical protein
VTSLTTERFGRPTSARGGRAFELARQRALDGLAGRTVWCATALPGGRALAFALRDCLDHVGEPGVSSRSLNVPASDELRLLGDRLTVMLAGDTPGTSRLGPEDHEVYDDGISRGEALVSERVAPDDVVVLDDAITAALARAVRERGAHAIWHVSVRRTHRAPAADDARAFLRPYASVLDAYVMTWPQEGPHGLPIERIGALMPSADRLAAWDVVAPDDPLYDVGWSAALASVVHDDRGQTVGGTRHVRPTVAVR